MSLDPLITTGEQARPNGKPKEAFLENSTSGNLVQASPAKAALPLPWQAVAIGAALAAAFVVFLTLAQFSTPNLAGNDGYYHIRLAELMRHGDLTPRFDWLPLTILNPDDFVDHHFLYHLALVPFTSLDLRLGAKLASVLFPAGAFLLIWWLLYRQKVPYAVWWSLGLLVISEAFLYRMSMPRVQALSLAFLALGLHWLLTGHHRRLMPLAFLYVWLYNAFPLILVVAGAYVAAGWLQDRRWRWRPLVYAGLGIALGLILNPYFPQNLVFIYRHLAPKLADPTATRVGSEWYPYETTQLMANSGLALLVTLAGIFALGLSGRRMDLRTTTTLILAVIFWGMVFQSRRFIEYAPPFALIFAATAWAPLLANSRLRVGAALGAIQTSLLKPDRRILASAGPVLVHGLVLAAFVPALWLNLEALQGSLGKSRSANRYATAAGWLAANTPAGARVFQTDWDDFPQLFYHNPHNTYTLGLDPTYMSLYDAELYDQWVAITRGEVSNPAAEIRDRFGAEYVFSDLKHRKFLKAARDDPQMQEVYRDGEAVVFKIQPMTQPESQN